MVAVRSAHINKAGEFDPKKWIASLGISSQQSCERLAETWAYCLQQTQGHPDADLLLWRGVEMVEILSTLSMDIDTLRAALLFPLADANVVSEDVTCPENAYRPNSYRLPAWTDHRRCRDNGGRYPSAKRHS